MRRTHLVPCVLIGTLIAPHLPASAATCSVASSAGSPELRYSAYAEDAAGEPLTGRHELVLRYLDRDSSRPVYVETHTDILVTGGRFALALGEGFAAPELHGAPVGELLACLEAIEIEVAIDGVVQAPRISMRLASGRAAEASHLLGAQADRSAGPASVAAGSRRDVSLQAVILRPDTAASDTGPSDHRQVYPYLTATVFHGTSRPVRSLPSFVPSSLPGPRFFDPQRGDFSRHIQSYETSDLDPSAVDDPLALESRLPKVGTPGAPELMVDFDGLSSTIFGPPDTEGAVGPDHYLQGVNISFRIFDKQGRPLTEPIATNALWADSGSVCSSDLYADLVVAYDEAADRWVLIHLAADFDVGITTCIAVSISPDPAGEYFLYELRTVDTPDYPKLGVWPDSTHNAYFIGTNPGPPGTFDVYAVDRASLIAGIAPRPAQRFGGNPNFMMPADLDGSRAAPNGSPGIFYTFRDGGNDEFIPGTPVDTLDLYEFAVDWENPALSSLSHVRSFTPPEFAPFNYTVCSRDVMGECLSQPGTSQLIDDISWLPMQRLQYRNLGRYETLVGLWTVNAVGEGRHAALRWFELRRRGGGEWEIAHQGTFAPDGSHRWMGSVALDGSGNMAMGYNVVNADAGIYPSLRYTVRPVDSRHFVRESTQISGTGSLDSLSRWGDYSSMEVDPADDCTFWFTGEYVETSGPSSWQTRISSFKVPGCTGWLRPEPFEDDAATAAQD